MRRARRGPAGRGGGLGLWVAFVALLLGAGAAGADDLLPRLEPWPLWMHDAAPVAGLRSSSALGPLFRSFESEQGPRGWALPPLVSRLRGPEGLRLELLYPLGQLSVKPDGWRLRLTPLVDARSLRVDPRVGKPAGASRWIFLLAFGGRTAAREAYFGIFPLGGTARQRFGLERLSFWLFPLFGRSEDANGFRRTHLLWPFFSWGSGGGRSFLRVWPFYGRDLREQSYERHFALWPFLHWRRENIGGVAERRVRLLLPFYGESVREGARARFFLGPLYAVAENELTGERSRDFLWPFVRLASRAPSPGFSGSSELRVEPVFRRRVAPGRVRTATLLGAVEHSVASSESRSARGWRLLWVSRIGRTRDLDSGSERVRRDLWPFFRFEEERSPDGGRVSGRALAPWLLPLRGAGWERSWLAPITFYSHRWRGEESRSDWLWGLLRSRRTPEQEVDSLGWLLRHERARDGHRSLRVLGLPIIRAD